MYKIVAGYITSFLLTLIFVSPIAIAGTFQDLGAPVQVPGVRGVVAGPNAANTADMVYLVLSESGPMLFLSVDPYTGAKVQYAPPAGADQLAQGMVCAPDKRIYISTGGTGQILRFDPANASKGLVILGRPAASESYIFSLAVGTDGMIYGCTYPSAKLIRVNPATGAMSDLGRMDSTQMYARYIAAGKDGKVYTAVAPSRQDIVIYDPATSTHKSLLPSAWRVSGFANIQRGADGYAYATVSVPGQGKTCYRLNNGAMTKVSSFTTVLPTLRDGQTITNVQAGAGQGSFVVNNPSTGAKRTVKFSQSYRGADLFMVAPGPDGNVYGSSDMPLGVFVYRIATGATQYLGTMPGSEVYSMAPWQNKLYMNYYGGAVMTLYDPTVATWSYGDSAGANPQSFGPLGEGHYRADQMIVGPGGRIYIGSEPDYGQLGGAMAVWDPAQNKVVENYRNIVKDQSVVSLAYEPTSGLVFGGSGTLGGGGATPTATQAVVFAFDPVKKVKLYELAPLKNAVIYQAMTAAAGKVFACTGSQVYVIDPARKAVVKTLVMKGVQVQSAIGVYKGMIYGCSNTSIYRVDPVNLTITVLASAPVTIRRGFAALDSGVYFGSGSHLWRYKW